MVEYSIRGVDLRIDPLVHWWKYAFDVLNLGIRDETETKSNSIKKKDLRKSKW